MVRRLQRIPHRKPKKNINRRKRFRKIGKDIIDLKPVKKQVENIDEDSMILPPEQSKKYTIIGQGSFGCVVSPYVTCPDEDPLTIKENIDKKVSKIMETSSKYELEDAAAEYEIGKKLLQVDPQSLFFLAGMRICKYSKKNVNLLQQCFPDTPVTKLKKNLYLNIQMKHALEFEKVLKHIYTQKNLIYTFAHLVLGAGILTTKSDMVLMDIKKSNLLFEYSSNNLYPVFIDFSPTYVLRKGWTFVDYCHGWKNNTTLYHTWTPEIKAIVSILQKPKRAHKFHTLVLNRIIKYNEVHNEDNFVNQKLKDYYLFDPFIYHYQNLEDPRNVLIGDIVKSMKYIVEQCDTTRVKNYAERNMLWQLSRLFLRYLPPVKEWGDDTKHFHKYVLMPCLHPNYEKRLDCNAVLTIINKIYKIRKLRNLKQYCIAMDESILHRMLGNLKKK